MFLKKYTSIVAYRLAEKLLQRNIRGKYKQAKSFYGLPLDVRIEQNTATLYSLLKSAGQHVPYYRDLFRQYKFKPEFLFESVSSFESLPYMTKAIIQEQGTRLFDERVTKFIHRQTGASTGPATSIYFDKHSLDWTAGNNLLALEWAGKKLGDKEVHLSSYFKDNSYRAISKEFFKCFALNRNNIFTSSYTEEQFNYLLKKITEARPYIMQGHPSTLYALACYVMDSGVIIRKPLFDVFESTGEKLTQHYRDTIEKTLGCMVYDRYGAAEFGVIAHETSQYRNCGCLPMFEHQVWGEEFTLGGGLNELVFTNLTNFAMPLIRYRMGDLGAVEQGEKGFFIKKLEGRIYEVVTLNGKKYLTHYFHDILTRVGGVSEFQILTDDNNELLEIMIVPMAGCNIEAVKQYIFTELGAVVTVRICSFSELKRFGWRNKFKHIVKKHQSICNNFSEIQTSDSNKKKILIVCHSLAINGANNHLRDLISHTKKYCDYSVLSVSEGPMRQVFEKLGMEVAIFAPERMPDWSEYSLVLGNTLMTTHILCNAISHTQIMITVHEAWNPDCLQQHIDAFEFGKYISEETIKRALLNAQAITFPALFQANLYRPLLSEQQNIQHIYCTVAVKEIQEYKGMVSRADARKQLGINPDSVVFVQIGTVTPRKNQVATLKAFEKFCQRNNHVNAQLYLVGARRSRAGESAYIDQILLYAEEANLQNKVHVVDTVPCAYVYMRAADVMLHPALNEVLPLAVLEGGAFELPVVTSNRDGLPEIITSGENGFLLDPLRLDAIVLCMEKLAFSPELRFKLGSALHSKVLEQHHPDSFQERWRNALCLR